MPMRTVVLAAMPILLSAGGAATAQDRQPWVEIFTMPDGVGSIDPASIKAIEGGLRSAWAQTKWSVPKGGGAVRRLELYRINCADETGAVATFIDYDANGTVLKAETTKPYMLSWLPAAPGTYGERVTQVICRFELN